MGTDCCLLSFPLLFISAWFFLTCKNYMVRGQAVPVYNMYKYAKSRGTFPLISNPRSRWG